MLTFKKWKCVEINHYKMLQLRLKVFIKYYYLEWLLENLNIFIQQFWSKVLFIRHYNIEYLFYIHTRERNYIQFHIQTLVIFIFKLNDIGIQI